MSAYDQYLSSLEKEDQGKNQLVASLSEAATANPDEFANMVKLSRAAKVSADAVADYKTEAQQAQYLGDVGLDRLWRDAPKTANFLTVPENAKMAKDDHENLTGIEGAFDYLKNRGRAVAAAIPKANAGLWGAAAAPFELLGIDSVGGYLRDQQRTTNRMAKAWGPQDNPGWMTNAIDQGLTSAGQQLATLPMAFLPGGQNAALTAMVAPVFGESYGKARDKGLTAAQSIQYGTQDAAAEWVFERYGLGNLVKNVKAGTGYGRTLVEFMLREVPSEMATTVVQSFNEYANVNPDKPVGEWAAQLPDELAQTVVATLVGGSAISTTAKAVDSAVRAVEKRAALAEESNAMADMLGNINQYIAASTTLQRDPQTFATFIEQATEDGPVPDVFISAQTLQQSGLAEQLAAVSPAIAEQFQTALETGGDIRIPVAEYATAIAPTEYAQGLIDHLKVEPEGMSRAEAQEYLQSGKAQELQTEVDRILAEQTDEGAFKQSAEAVRSNLQTQLDTAARFTPEVNSAYASMVGNFYAVMAANLGITPEAMFSRFPLQIGAESVAGQQFAQGDDARSRQNILDLFDEADTINIEAPQMTEQEIDDAERFFLSHFPASVTTYRRTSGIARRIRQASDNAADFIGDNPETARVVDSALGPFSGYRAEGVTLAPDDAYNPGGVLKVKIYGKEQVEAGLLEEPALTFTVMQDGELSVNGPTPGGATFEAFKERGWAEQAKAGDQIAEGWSNLVNPEGGKMPMGTVIPLLADVHARVRAWKMEDYTGLYWARATGALAGLGDYGSAMFFQGQPNAPRMMAVHNLSADNLIFADRMGGLAVPSVGVVTEQAGGVDGFGEITLVGSKNLVDPAKERVFSSDAYTARFPAPEWPKAKSKDAQALVDGIRDAAKEFDDRGIIDETWDNMTNTPDAGKVIDAWLRSNTIKATYLREQGVEVKPVMRNPSKSTPVPAERLAGLEPLWAPVEKLYWSLSRDELIETPEYQALAEAYRQIVTEAYEGKKRPDAMIARLAEFRPNDVEKLGNDLKNAGKQEVDTWETSKQLSEQTDQQAVAFKQWVEGKVLPKFGDPFIKVGGKKAPYTLRNIVEVMTDTKVKGKEKTMTYGAGQVRAAASVEFSDIEQMREHAAKQITNPAEYEAARAQAEKQLDTYRQAVVEFTKLRDWRGQADTWEALDASMRALAKWATGKKRDAKAMTAALKAEDFDTAKIPAEVIGQAMAAGNALMQAPVPYFEAKPQRAVSLDEFAGAVVPAGAPQVVLDILAKHGIEVVEYSGEESRWEVARNLARNLSERGVATLFQNQQAPRGSFNPASLQITLLKGADLSTFLHESGHFFLEVQVTVAEQLQKEAEVFGLDTLKPGEQQIVQDAKALMEWFGLRDLAEWNALDFEEKRTYHEQFARGFEAYLFEGKAPSIEMQGLFQRFRAWLLSVYRDLKALNVELTDEVRGVMERMLATNEHIATAEQGRSMMPLFTSAEQAGMTMEEFAAYQALGVDATNDAIQDLQARGLRDMQWLNNARGRVIKQLQQQSKEIRATVQMDVRREVMAMPIYRAWSFLTGKRTADDTFENPQPPKSSPDTLDETLDSLFVAMAKLGGINKDEAVGTWGIDQADKPSSGVFGKPVWRREGGLSLDGMLEALAQYGYLELDENGKPDLREFEDKFKAELGGDAQYSTAYDYAGKQPVAPGEQLANPQGLTAGRLDLDSLAEIGLPVELVNHLKALRMTAKSGGLHADLVAEMFGFTSGDELTRTLAAAEAPKDVIEAMTDQRMLEQYGDLSSQEAIEKAADKAIHNDARARMVATELAMLEKAVGDRRTLASAAKEYAAVMIARLKVRNIKPGQYASAEVRAAKAAAQARESGDIAKAAAEKRNQLVNTYATKAAYAAQDEIDAGLRYLKKFEGAMKGLDVGYQEQIANLLERFDLRKGQSLKAIDKRTALSSWLEAQREAGFEPDIPDDLVNEAYRTSYKNLTVEEFRGLVDTVKQIEHLGRLKKKLLTAKDQREYEVIRDEIATSIVLNADNRQADTRTPDTVLGKALLKMRQFWASHIKSAMWARIMDGGKDGGPMWEYFIRSANERGDMETTMRAEATAKLSEILAPVFKSGKLTTKTYFPSIKRSLTREGRIAIALNWGNEGNRQRLMGGEGWTPAQVQPVLESLTADELRAVQAIWDHFESYRPEIGAKEKRVYGKEPDWVSPAPFIVSTADGQQITMRGGYYPIKYDPMASQRAEEHADAESAQRQLKGAYTTATTRRSFTKSRAEEVSGRPLLYSLAGVYSGVNDVIHDLAWHEWLIDTNRLLRSNTIDQAIRTHYGPAVKAQFKKWSEDIAEGDKASTDAGDIAVNYLRQSVSVAGLGFNVMSAAMQPLGITQSIVRVGAQWVGRGISKYIAHPVQLTREVNSMSDFMANRARTRNRELHELRNQVEGQTAVKEFVGKYAYFLMMRFQQAVDVPTWWGAYEKAVAEGNDDDRAVALADQAVIDAQGGGMLKDQSGIERTDPKGKLFTVFYSFMNSALTLGVVTGMTEKSRAKQAANYALLYIIPPMLAFALKAAITPGDSGDDDLEKIAKKLLAAQIDYLMGMMVYVREFSDVAKTLAGANDLGRDYQGPAGLRLVADAGKFAHQVAQGEMDDALRKSFVNIMGDLFGLPSAQINRMITGSEAMAEGKTDNPAAVVFGFQEKR